jgi:DNA polymerase
MTLAKPPLCAACSLFTKGQGYAPGYGTGANRVLLLGEALGAREAVVGVPFVGDAGAQLNRTLQRVQNNKDQFRVNNVVHCRPPSNWLEGAPWEEDAINNCTVYFHEELDRHPPKVIVPMGNVAANFILGRKDRKGGIEDRRGYVYPSVINTPKGQHTVWVVPTYHPSFIMRGHQNLTDVQAIDIKRALRVSKEGYKEDEYSYIEHPTSADLAEFFGQCRIAAGSGKWLIADIETPTSGGATEDEYGDIVDAEIIRISFSIEPHKAITIPWTSWVVDWIMAILGLPWSFVVFWNQEFDVPRLQSKGCVLGGKVLDAMYMWHFLQSDLPKGLGYVSTFFTKLSEWKSLSEELPEYYSCKDSDATIQCADAIRSLLERQNRFGWFVKHYVDLQPYVDSMAASGVCVDLVQQDKFRGEVQKELDRLDEAVQKAVPTEVKKVKYRKSYPKEFELGAKVRESDEHWYWDFDPNTGEILERQKFLCTSSKQVLEYIKFRGHPVETNYKTGKETTAADVIDKLADKFPDDPLYPRILEVREFRKIMGQYVNGYAPDPDGRVRTHFNRKPSTWRFNSTDPNVQNVIKRGELAMEYRKQFVAGTVEEVND